MSYLYETHLHARESSLCATASAADYPAFYKSLGYDGIFITDHFYRGNTCISTDGTWEEFVHAFCRSYETAKAAGDAIGFPVFFGFEERFELDEYLIYGIDKAWLLAHPELRTLSRAEYLALVRAAGGLVVHAHALREYSYAESIPLPVESVDAYEGWNGGTPIAENLRTRALALHLGKPVMCGSDRHTLKPSDRRLFGIVTETPINSVEDFMNIVREKAYQPHDLPPHEDVVTPPTKPLHVFDVLGNEMTPTATMRNLPPVFFQKY